MRRRAIHIFTQRLVQLQFCPDETYEKECEGMEYCADKNEEMELREMAHVTRPRQRGHAHADEATPTRPRRGGHAHTDEAMGHADESTPTRPR